MSTASSQLTISGISIDVIRKNIKNLHIGVYPPTGRVRVSAPERLNDDQVRLAIIHRLSWIRRKQLQLQSAERQSEREMITGESHFVWGRRLRLVLVEEPGTASVSVVGDRLTLSVPPETSADRRRHVVDEWYRSQLKAVLPGLVLRWSDILGVEPPLWQIQRMKTKWGSCNREAARIRLNLELAKKHPDCLDYVVVHEMTHLLERHHGDPFIRLIDGFMPNWRQIKKLLDQAPLDPQEWSGSRL